MRVAGAWTIHIVLIICLKILYDTLPGVSQETSWTLTNISYMLGSYIMFHYVRGIPFDFNSGAYDNLNMWEQIDHGDQFTPSKKFLLSVPIVLFLLSTHYSRYDLSLFIVNLLAVLAVVIPKLPSVGFPHPPGEDGRRPLLPSPFQSLPRHVESRRLTMLWGPESSNANRPLLQTR